MLKPCLDRAVHLKPSAVRVVEWSMKQPQSKLISWIS